MNSGDRQDTHLAGLEIDGKYELLEEIGSGGVGTVYRARHMALDKTVAIKLLQTSLKQDTNIQQRFEREARILSTIESARVVKFLGWGYWQDDRAYLVTEFLEGETLAQWMQGKVPWKTAFEVGIQTCVGLEAIHGNGAIHRDLSISNIFMLKSEAQLQVKVIDLGLSFVAGADNAGRLTQTGVLLGSFHYMSPEACSGAKVTPNSDVYSLGCIIYELIAGKKPLEATEPLRLIFKHTTHYPQPLSKHVEVPRDIENIVFKALQKRSENRYQTAKEFRQDLERAINGQSPIAADLDWTEKKSYPFALLTVAIIGLVLFLLLAATLTPRSPALPNRITRRTPVDIRAVLRKAAQATEADPYTIGRWQSSIKGMIENIPADEQARRMQAYLVLVLLELSLYEKTNGDASHLEIARECGKKALDCASNGDRTPNRAQSVPYELLARIACVSKDYGEAARLYELALNAATRDLPSTFVLEYDLPGASEPEGLSSKYMLELGKCYEKCGDLKKAEKCFRDCITSLLNLTSVREPRLVRFTVGPRGAIAAVELSLLMRKCGRAGEMKKIIGDIGARYQEEDKELLFDHGRDASFYALLGEAALVSGDVDSATRLYEKALPSLHDNQLVDIGRSLGDLRQAIRVKNRADLLPVVANLERNLTQKLSLNQSRKTQLIEGR